jgi:hypothetical protein
MTLREPPELEAAGKPQDDENLNIMLVPDFGDD